MLKRKRISSILLALVMLFSVMVALPKQASAATGFDDVEGHDLENYITYVSDEGAFQGDAGKFMPQDNIKRGQVAAVLARAKGLTSAVASDFSDVSADHIFTKDIAAVAKAGIFEGYEDGTFKPEEFITRGQAAKVIAIAYDYKEVDGEALEFEDVEDDNIFKPYIDALTSNGVLSGDNGKFNPNSDVTRGQFAKYLAAPLGYVEVVSVVSIDEIEVKVKFNQAAPEDNLAMAVVVKDNKGNLVPTKTTVVFEGDKEATFTFDPAVATAKLVGVWTVDGVEYNFDDMILFDKIMKELDGNPYIFQELLDEAGITHAQGTKAGLEAYMELLDSLPLDEGTAEILGLDDEFKLETLADIQTLISAIDKVVADSAVDVAKVLAVAKAKTPNQLLAALKANYKMVNSEWKDAYASVLLGSYTDDLIKNLEADPINPQHAVEAILISEEIQEEIYAINYYQIDDVENDAASAADFAAVITLINTWLPADAEGETKIADWIQELKVAVAEFKVAEATTPNNLYNALVNYANVAADEDDEDVLLLSELNDKLKAFYYEVFEGLDLTEGGDHPYYDTYVKYSIVEPADVAAREAAMLAIETAYEAINAAENEEEDSTTAAQKTALKTALQKLAEYTSHLKGDDKFDMSIVIDANLVAYAEEFAESTAIDNTSDVTAVVTKVNTVNDNAGILALVEVIKESTDVAETKQALVDLANKGKVGNFLATPAADRDFVAAELVAIEDRNDLDSESKINAKIGTVNTTISTVVNAANAITRADNSDYAKTKELLVNFDAYDNLGTLEKQDVEAAFYELLTYPEGTTAATDTPAPAFTSYTGVKALVDQTLQTI